MLYFLHTTAKSYANTFPVDIKLPFFYSESCGISLMHTYASTFSYVEHFIRDNQT